MQHDKVALRYARAAFEALSDSEERQKAAEDLRGLGEMLEANVELRLALTSAIFSEENRWAVVQGIGEKAQFGQGTLKVLRVLNQAKRLGAAGVVGEKLRTLGLQGEGILPIRVQSATELSSDEQSAVEKRFTDLLGKKVQADYVVAPVVMGGLRVDAEGRTYQGTVAGWLEGFEEKLVGG